MCTKLCTRIKGKRTAYKVVQVSAAGAGVVYSPIIRYVWHPGVNVANFTGTGEQDPVKGGTAVSGFFHCFTSLAAARNFRNTLNTRELELSHAWRVPCKIAIIKVTTCGETWTGKNVNFGFGLNGTRSIAARKVHWNGKFVRL